MRRRATRSEQYYVGLDVHSRQSALVIEDDEGRLIAQGDPPKVSRSRRKSLAVRISGALRSISPHFVCSSPPGAGL